MMTTLPRTDWIVPKSFPLWRAALLLLAAVVTVFVQPANAQPANAQQDARQQAPVQGYVLGPNDGISVRVYGHDEFSIVTRVKPDGSIVMPLIGRVDAAGTNVIQLANVIESRLKAGNYLRDPIVNIEITEYNSGYVRVAGRVGSPGLVPLDRSTSLLDVLLRAGWVRDDGSRHVLLRRATDNSEERIDMDAVARGEGRNVQLRPGDTLFVDEAELVYVTGAINRPGGYAITPGMTVAKLIAAAGGVSQSGSSGRVGLKRDGKDSTVDDQTVVQKDDVIHIRERLF